MSSCMQLGSARGLSYQVGNAEVHGQGNDGWHQASPECAGKVGDIADEPDDEEDERNSISRARPVVLDQLRDLVLLANSHDYSRVRAEISLWYG